MGGVFTIVMWCGEGYSGRDGPKMLLFVFSPKPFFVKAKVFPFVKSLTSRKSKIAHQFSESFFVLPAEGRKQPTGQVEVESCAGWGWGGGESDRLGARSQSRPRLLSAQA